jgi:hypothetical protein|tara:strand:+ start:7 stop:246 length:240 start_codon:yes stop_codon:yes gene_type:complete
MRLSDEMHSKMVMHILQNGFHLPIKEGKCNKEAIEEKIVVGLYQRDIPPLDQEDVDWICLLINDLITDYKNNPQEYRQG